MLYSDYMFVYRKHTGGITFGTPKFKRIAGGKRTGVWRSVNPGPGFVFSSCELRLEPGYKELSSSLKPPARGTDIYRVASSAKGFLSSWQAVTVTAEHLKP